MVVVVRFRNNNETLLFTILNQLWSSTIRKKNHIIVIVISSSDRAWLLERWTACQDCHSSLLPGFCRLIKYCFQLEMWILAADLVVGHFIHRANGSTPFIFLIEGSLAHICKRIRTQPIYNAMTVTRRVWNSMAKVAILISTSFAIALPKTFVVDFRLTQPLFQL